MDTNYQMWLTCNAEADKLRIPVLPEKVTVSIGSKNTSVQIAELGEIVIKQARPAFQFSIKSFFPVGRFPGLTVPEIVPPLTYVAKINSWLNGKLPVHFIVTGIGIDVFCTIEKFSYYEEGGDTGTIYFELTLKEYREVTIRQVQVAEEKATVDETETRVDNTSPPKTYTVVAGDCLWNIAQKFYGNGSLYTKIYEANKDVIDARNKGHRVPKYTIYVGQVFTIPD